MPSKSASKSASKPPAQGKARTTDMDDYLLDSDLDDLDNPFRSPSPQADKDRRKEASGLGIDEEVEVKKRAYVPRVKLDEVKLLSPAGIPTLRQRAKRLKLKGKGHEWSDASKILSLYQLWLDDLYPKAKFLDALAMVEKAGHKTSLHKARMEWIDEGKPKSTMPDEEEISQPRGDSPASGPVRIAPIFDKRQTSSGRPGTPGRDEMDLFGDDDIYNATPRAKAGITGGGEPDEDDIEALMAEAEAGPSIFGGPSRGTSLFGGKPNTAQTAPPLAAVGHPDEDDLDALMAETEMDKSAVPRPSIFGDGKPKPTSNTADDDLADDDLDALMAEAEDVRSNPPITEQAPQKAEADSFADEEEAMAEMDGLW